MTNMQGLSPQVYDDGKDQRSMNDPLDKSFSRVTKAAVVGVVLTVFMIVDFFAKDYLY